MRKANRDFDKETNEDRNSRRSVDKANCPVLHRKPTQIFKASGLKVAAMCLGAML